MKKHTKHPLIGVKDYVSKAVYFRYGNIYEYWFAEVDKIRINFSIKKYGNEAAFEMASYAARRLYKQIRGSSLRLS